MAHACTVGSGNSRLGGDRVLILDYTIVRKIIRDCFRSDKSIDISVPVVTVANDNSRSLYYRGKHYSPLVDTLEDDLAAEGIKCLGVSRIISRFKGDLSHGTVYSPEGGFARALLQKRLLAALRRDDYPYSKMEEVVWGRVLDQSQAKRVVAIQPSRELCVACHRRAVWVADLQHGVIAQRHPWYGAAFRADDPIEYLPNAFLCWDRGSEQVVADWAQKKGIATQVIGNRWLTRFLHPNPSDRMVRDLTQQYAAMAGRAGKQQTILVSLSWGEDNIPNGFIHDDLMRAIRESAPQIRWLIRLHPNQVKGFATDEGSRFKAYYDRFLSGCAEWEFPTIAPLPVVLQSTDLHISWASSVSIEAAQMGIKSALLNPRLRLKELAGDYFEYYRTMGVVDFVEASSASILSWIDRNVGSKRPVCAGEAADDAYRRLIEFLAKSA